MIATELANLKWGDNQHTQHVGGEANLPLLPPVTIPQAARMLNVSEKADRVSLGGRFRFITVSHR
jgi:hypothetical protein